MLKRAGKIMFDGNSYEKAVVHCTLVSFITAADVRKQPPQTEKLAFIRGYAKVWGAHRKAEPAERLLSF